MDKEPQLKSPFFIIFSTFVIALILNMVSYPDWMRYAKPDWVFLVLFYWCLATPQKVGVGCGWLIGLVMDILYYAILGQYAIGKTFVAFVASSAHRRLRLYDLWQQCFIIFIIASFDIVITTWIFHISSGIEISIVYWQSALTSTLLWPVIYNLLRVLRHRTGIR